jgi:hypothetical protein
MNFLAILFGWKRLEQIPTVTGKCMKGKHLLQLLAVSTTKCMLLASPVICIRGNLGKLATLSELLNHNGVINLIYFLFQEVKLFN